jgi:PKD repeat protein
LNYTWTPPTGLSSTTGSTVTSTVLATTTYTVTGTTSGCVGTATATVTISPNPTVTVNSATICAGSTATLTATGATSYTWSPPTGLSSTSGAIVTANPSTTTTYTVTGTSGSCTGTANATVTVNPIPTVSAQNNGPLCPGDFLQLFANGSSSATYVWSGPNGFSSTQQNPNIPAITAAAAGTYTVSITLNGCTSSSTTTLVVNPGVSSAITPVSALCVNSPQITLTAVTPGGVWSGTGITNPSTGTFDPSIAGSGIHAITYTIAGACGGPGTANIQVNALPQVNFSASVTSGCDPLTVVFTNLSTPVGTSVLWDLGNGQDAGAINSISTTYTSSGCKDVTLTVTDAAGCTNSLIQNARNVCAW